MVHYSLYFVLILGSWDLFRHSLFINSTALRHFYRFFYFGRSIWWSVGHIRLVQTNKNKPGSVWLCSHGSTLTVFLSPRRCSCVWVVRHCIGDWRYPAGHRISCSILPNCVQTQLHTSRRGVWQKPLHNPGHLLRPRPVRHTVSKVKTHKHQFAYYICINIKHCIQINNTQTCYLFP